VSYGSGYFYKSPITEDVHTRRLFMTLSEYVTHTALIGRLKQKLHRPMVGCRALTSRYE